MLEKKELAQLRWACRRGMLELDILLLPFFDACFTNLPKDQQDYFIELLKCGDVEMFSWVMENKEPDRKEFIPLLKAIRMYAQNHS